jgi:tRNA(Arg) A34 adenosine deaminase TadA
VTPSTPLILSPPAWLDQVVEWGGRYRTDEERMRVAVALARENVDRDTGGPFGAAVFTSRGELVSAGVNSVTRLGNSVLHAETFALMLAHAAVGSYDLGGRDGHGYALATSCEPCAMCLGATLWSGVGELICGATKEDATAVGFDEGPVFKESWLYLERRGVRTARQVLREEAAAVLELYRARGGAIY